MTAPGGARGRPRPVAARWTADPARVRPMLAATTPTPPLRAPDRVYEPKYDGIRLLAEVNGRNVCLRSRLGNDKTAQFAEVARALGRLGAAAGGPLLLDGELVALDARGRPASFLALQPRMHARRPPATPVAFVAFDLLRDGEEDLRDLPLTERRRRLERRLARADGTLVRLGEQVRGRGEGLWRRAQRGGFDGLVVKQAESRYASGRRSSAWCKLKLVRHQTCVVGGWTEPRGTRHRFGALLLGVHDDDGTLRYVGDVGSGFDGAALDRIGALLDARATAASPFGAGPATPARAHWVRPSLVVEVKFTEWTGEGRLRHPTFLGLRDDVDPSGVRREPDATAPAPPARPSRPAARRGAARAASPPAADPDTPEAADLIAQLDAIQAGRDEGTLVLPGGGRLRVGHLRKVFWPEGQVTKGDLFRHYVRVAPVLLPVLADRPLVMRRHPNGIEGKAFYQHRAPEPAPAGVRVATPAGDTDARPHLIGGSLATLLYCTQLAAVSQDPWLSRLGSEDTPDHAVIDLDPPEGLPFGRVRDLAAWIHDELEGLGVAGFPKTSGAGGLHIYVPMPPGTSYESAQLFCQIIATVVAHRHPKHATTERLVAARGRRIYVDYLQNKQGRTLASAYSARASAFAGVSTPVTWTELDGGLRPQDFTVRNFGARLRQAGDLWAGLRTARPADLRAVVRYARA